MVVKNLAAANCFSRSELVQKKNKGVRNLSAQARVLHEDSYISFNSILHSKDYGEVKAKDLSEIKKRISSGFYNSAAVNDDLAEVFSGIFGNSLSVRA